VTAATRLEAVADLLRMERRRAFRDVRRLIEADKFEYEPNYDRDDAAIDSIDNYRSALLVAIDSIEELRP
jgi:hypothetical protein